MKTLLIVLCLAAPVQAGSWLFRPATRPPAKVERRQRPREEYSNRGYRFSRSTINVGGYVFDNLYLFESWNQRK